MRLSDLPTPCLVLDRRILARNLASMAQAIGRHGVRLRPHMKTAKSIDVARMALALNGPEGDADTGGITVSTLAEAEYFAGHGLADMIYAVGITPQKLDQVAKLNASGAGLMIITDDADVASAISAHPHPAKTLIEIDTGEHRGGLAPEDDALLEIAGRLGTNLMGVITHAGHSYAARTMQDFVRIAEDERRGAVRAAQRLREAGFNVPIVSVGSSPTALAGTSFDGVTEIRAGVYMFGDLFQAEIGTHGIEDIAVSVLTSVIGHRPAQRRMLVDAGAMALSKDRSTQATANDQGFGIMVDMNGRAAFGRTVVVTTYQEHGVVELDPQMPLFMPPIGTKFRILPNHTCLTAAAHDRYFVIDDDSETVTAIWPRTGGW